MSAQAVEQFHVVPPELRDVLRIVPKENYDLRTREQIKQLMTVAEPGDRVTVFKVFVDGRVLIDLHRERPSPERVRAIYVTYLMLLRRADEEPVPSAKPGALDGYQP